MTTVKGITGMSDEVEAKHFIKQFHTLKKQKGKNDDSSSSSSGEE
jgi:hypothetical protein